MFVTVSSDCIAATGASNAIFDLPLDGGCRSDFTAVAVYGTCTYCSGVDTADAGGELI